MVEDKTLLKLIEATLDRRRPREWYYALMDYGAMLGRRERAVNPNRRSAGYKRQPAFGGSLRQARGRILRFLSARKTLPKTGGGALIGIPQKQFLQAVRDLSGEGFLQESRGRIGLLQ